MQKLFYYLEFKNYDPVSNYRKGNHRDREQSETSLSIVTGIHFQAVEISRRFVLL